MDAQSQVNMRGGKGRHSRRLTGFEDDYILHCHSTQAAGVCGGNGLLEVCKLQLKAQNQICLWF